MLYVLNAPILTDYGTFKFSQISVEEAKKMLENGFTSAVGHQSTAELLTSIFEILIPMNRISIKMNIGDRAIIFRLLTRLEEGKVLTTKEIKELPYEFGLLERIE